MIDNISQDKIDELQKEIEKKFAITQESISKSISDKITSIDKLISDKIGNIGKSISVKKYDAVPNVVKKELDRIDESIADMTVSPTDLAVQIPFARNLGGGGGISYDYVYVGGRKYAVTAEKTSNFLQVNNDGTSLWVAAMPDVMPTNAEVYDVTKNEIHLPGEMAE